MNKKFLSAILFGALMVTSTGTFVSCKDYDENIENLQSQINNLATKSDVEAKLSQLQAAIDAAKAESASNAAKIAALTKCECDVDAMMAEIKDAVDADMAGYKAEIEALVAEVEALVGKVADFVTDVELNITGTDRGYAMDFYTITEKENVFEEGVANALTFVKDKQTIIGETPIVVRVSPTNAVLTPEMVSLVNSKGENLNEYLDIEVEKYTDLLSRGATNNGLWKITPVLKKYDDDQFAALKYVDVEDKTKGEILYAIQINNALDAAEARYVTSAYSITMGESTPFEGNGILHYTVDDVPVYMINNRYSANSKSLPKFEGGAEMYKELRWKGFNNPVVATEAIVEGDDINVDGAGGTPDRPLSVFDDRSQCKPALAVQGKPMTIAITDYTDFDTPLQADGEKNDKYEGKIAGLYVTLDYKANAVESAPSEWNAWNSYKYTGLNTVVKGTSIEITIDSEETINDYIGFRVYAVNLDGTLVDPDGRAFYVLVGEQAADAQTVTATITPTNDPKSRTSVTKALTDAQSEVITSLLKNQKNNPSVVMAEDEADKYGVVYNVKFNKSDDGKKYVSATFELADGEIADMINDKTYKASIVYKNANGHILGEVNFELTKTMPTTFPADFAFRPKQETTDGSGKFIAYMVPENGYDKASEWGIKNLNNVFYGLDANYKFVFGTSAADADEDGVLNNVTVTSTGQDAEKNYIYNLRVSESEANGYFIDNTTAHAVSVAYLYPGISTYSYTDENGKEAWKHGATHSVAYDKALEATYACWEDASAFVWGTYKSEDGKSVLSHKPVLKWTAEAVGAKANLSDIESTNAYNNDYFGLDLESLVVTKGWLSIKDIELTVNEQVNPYFKPAVDGSVIKFNQISQQVDAAPTANHEETLVITVVDAFGHESTISLDVTVKAPEKK